MKHLPAYYSRNGYECFAAFHDDRDGTVQLVMRRPRNFSKTRFEYCVWIGCNVETGETGYGVLTRQFDTKDKALSYAKHHSGRGNLTADEVA